MPTTTDRWIIHSRTLTRSERTALEAFFKATETAAKELADRLDPKRQCPRRGVVAKLDAIRLAALQGRLLLLTPSQARAYRRELFRKAA